MSFIKRLAELDYEPDTGEMFKIFAEEFRLARNDVLTVEAVNHSLPERTAFTTQRDKPLREVYLEIYRAGFEWIKTGVLPDLDLGIPDVAVAEPGAIGLTD